MNFRCLENGIVILLAIGCVVLPVIGLVRAVVAFFN